MCMARECMYVSTCVGVGFLLGRNFIRFFSSNTKVEPKSCNFHDSIFKCGELSHIKEGAFRRVSEEVMT